MRRFVCGSAALLVIVLALPQRVTAQEPTTTQSRAATALLAMPFVPQSEALCGGAALAMVLRHHGQRGIAAEDFAHLVTDAGTGILTTDMAAAARERGLLVTAFTGSSDIVRALLGTGSPVITLIEDRPGIYHYVVLLAWGDGRVLFHDPAIGPHQVMEEAAFTRAWEPAGYWALRTDAGADADRGTRAAVASPAPPSPGLRADSAAAEPRGAPESRDTVDCRALVGAAAAAASMNDLDRAERLLDTADGTCADMTLVARERAGLRFRQRRYEEAEADVLLRLGAAPDDAYAWNLLGASRFVRGDRDGALVAWNRIDRPFNDLTRIEGLHRTPFAVVSDAVDIARGRLVTAPAVARARRRAAALPAIARARVDYRPVSGDTVQVDVAVLEHAVLPVRPLDLAVHAVRAASEQRVLVRPANLVRLGERWRIDGTWQENRQGLSVGVSIPRVLGLRAVTHLDAGTRDWTFADAATGAAAARVCETRRSATLALSDWASGSVAWRAGMGIDDWAAVGAAGRVFMAGELHVEPRGVVVAADVSGWLPADADGFARARVTGTVRTSQGEHTETLVVLHGALTNSSAPRSLWHGAGTGRTGRALLRAHPLIDDAGVIRSPWWAPRLVAATLEARQWLASAGPVEVGLALFVDGAVAGGGTAGAADGGAGANARGAVDGGAGLRLRLAGGPVLRLDAAHGIGNGARALSIALVGRTP